MDRTYGSSFNQNKASVAFGYIEDLSLNGGSGLWRPARASDFNAPAYYVSNTGLATSLTGAVVPATLFNIKGYSDYTGVQYLQIYDGVNASGTLVNVAAVQGKSNFNVDFGDRGITTQSGIYIQKSLTPVAVSQGAADTFITISFGK